MIVDQWFLQRIFVEFYIDYEFYIDNFFFHPYKSTRHIRHPTHLHKFFEMCTKNVENVSSLMNISVDEKITFPKMYNMFIFAITPTLFNARKTNTSA